MLDIISRKKFEERMKELYFVKECRIKRINNDDKFEIAVIIADDCVKGKRYDSLSWEEDSSYIYAAAFEIPKETFEVVFTKVFKSTYNKYAEC